jgi:hypothetical protein
MSGHKPHRPQNNPDSDPHKKPGEKESTNRHVYVEPGVQIDFVKNLRDKHDANRKRAQPTTRNSFFGR